MLPLNFCSHPIPSHPIPSHPIPLQHTTSHPNALHCIPSCPTRSHHHHIAISSCAHHQRHDGSEVSRARADIQHSIAWLEILFQDGQAVAVLGERAQRKGWPRMIPPAATSPHLNVIDSLQITYMSFVQLVTDRINSQSDHSIRQY